MNLRNLRSPLTSLIILIAPFTGFAQDQPIKADPRLPEIAAIQQKKDQENYAITMNLAKQKQWPLEIPGKEGRVAKLVGVDAFGFPMYFETLSNVNAAATIGTNNLWTGGSTGLNLTGSSPALKNKLALWDGGGVNANHVELIGRITAKDAQGSEDGHATHVAGTMIASGVSAFARGMAYEIPGILSYTFTSHLGEMAGEARICWSPTTHMVPSPAGGIMIHSHVGNSTATGVRMKITNSDTIARRPSFGILWRISHQAISS